MILVIVDMFSQEQEDFIMNCDCGSTVEKCVSSFDLSRVKGTGYGSQCCSVQLLYNNGIKHNSSPPYHPATNGFTKKFIKIIKTVF